MTFTPTITGGSATDQEFVSVAFTEAAKQWSAVLDHNLTASIEVAISLKPLPAGVIAQAAPYYFWYDDSKSATPTHLEPGATHEMNTGIDEDGADPDIFIAVDVAKLAQTPNAILALMHEIGHGVAATGSQYGDTLFDDHVVNGQFVGEFSTAVNGGPVPLAGYHIAVFGSLMYPSDDGLSGFTARDLAMFADAAVPIDHAYLPALVA